MTVVAPASPDAVCAQCHRANYESYEKGLLSFSQDDQPARALAAALRAGYRAVRKAERYIFSVDKFECSVPLY
jgi:hypothetical protein